MNLFWRESEHTMYILYTLALLAGIHICLTWIAAMWRGLRARHQGRLQGTLPSNKLPFVSVLIPAWQEDGTIESCIASLKRVDYPDWEVIIIAGGPDGTYRVAAEACQGNERFRVIKQQPAGKNAALNQGLRLAQGGVIVTLDADCIVSPDWLHALVAPLGEEIHATTGNAIPLRQTSISRAEQMERIAAYGIRKIFTLQGSGSIAIMREDIEAVDGFPEEVKVGVDWDLNARLAARNIVRAFCPRAIVHTARPATLREYWRNEVRWRRAHFSSLIRLSEYFFHDFGSALTNLYIYGLSWLGMLFTLVTGIVVLVGPPEIRALVFGIWGLFAAWLLLRRAALAGEVAAYTRDLGWLKLIWVPHLLLCLTLAASVLATLTFKKSEIHFKGPRMQRVANHEG